VTRAELWLPLLRRLTHSVPSWAIWKNPESALSGEGDVDAVAAAREWGSVVGAYRAWAQEHGLGPVVACTHIPDLLVLVALQAGDAPGLLQMDVYSRRVFRGATIATADDLRLLVQLDERGFRRLRPGAEATWLLLANGVRLGGRPPIAPATAAIGELLREDPDGAEAAAAIIGKRGHHVLAAANAIAAGGWDRRSLLLFELDSVGRLIRRPTELATCVRRDFRRFRPCALLRALEDGRRVPGDRDVWLAELRRSHTIYDTGDTA
jgi:hypothetical protein